MALPDNILVEEGNPILFRDVTDYAPAAANTLTHDTPTSVQLDLTALDGTAPTNGRASAKIDLGAARADEYEVLTALEFAATPTAGNTVDFYWAPSPSSTAATGNPAGISGSDADYSGQSSNLDASLPQLQYIGSFINSALATGTIQCGCVGRFRPAHRYGCLVVVNRSGANLHSDAVEMSVVMNPINITVED